MQLASMASEMYTIGTLFSGGEGVGVGGRLAGLQHLWGIEIDDAVAQVARDNGFAVETADILEADPDDYETPTVLHASPPCPNFSVAKQGRRESRYDVALAMATARFIEELLPRFFTLENVWAYRKSASWRIVANILNYHGYWYDLAHVNAADFGVPQARKRMIVRAALGQMVPQLPQPEPWIGWYQAIEDLIPTLPESQFAPWQLARLELGDTTLVDSAGYPDKGGARVPGTRHADEPANTVLANHAGRGMRAFLMQAQGAAGKGYRLSDEPMQSVTAAHGTAKYRAFLVGGANTSSVQAAPGVGVSQMDEPTRTVCCSNSVQWRAWLSRGRVVQMTPRALARFQAFPDSYILPNNKTLACRIVGEAVPPLLYEKLIKQLLNL